jgi:hypothetical protein
VTSLTSDDIGRMRDQVFFQGPEGKRRVTRFWLLLLLYPHSLPVGPSSGSVARCTLADAPSTAARNPLLPFRSVAR